MRESKGGKGMRFKIGGNKEVRPFLTLKRGKWHIQNGIKGETVWVKKHDGDHELAITSTVTIAPLENRTWLVKIESCSRQLYGNLEETNELGIEERVTSHTKALNAARDMRGQADKKFDPKDRLHRVRKFFNTDFDLNEAI